MSKEDVKMFKKCMDFRVKNGRWPEEGKATTKSDRENIMAMSSDEDIAKELTKMVIDFREKTGAWPSPKSKNTTERLYGIWQEEMRSEYQSIKGDR